MMNTWIDGTVYPDREPPTALVTLAEQVDFLARLCAAWDMGILPTPETVREIRRREWGQAVGECRLLTSPAYHLVRLWHHLPSVPYLGQRLAYIAQDPNLEHV